jgi:hypothetical protein
MWIVRSGRQVADHEGGVINRGASLTLFKEELPNRISADKEEVVVPWGVGRAHSVCM